MGDGRADKRKKWSVAAEKAEKKDAEVDTDDDSGEWTDESDNEDPDGELGRLQWIERTKKDIATAVPHESNPFWNCVICGNQVSNRARKKTRRSDLSLSVHWNLIHSLSGKTRFGITGGECARV